MKAGPNIVMIVMDSVRRDHLSCYGYRRPTTPNIDHVAREGVRFLNAYASSCWTIPAHASLFTGLYPSQHGADFDTRRLEAEHETVAGLLRRAGYRTACITANGFLTDHTNLNQGFERTIDVDRLAGGSRGLLRRAVRGVHRRWRNLTARDRGARRATRTAAWWLDAQDDDRPFFLFLNYMECHSPYRLRGRSRYRFVPEGDREAADAVPQDPFRVMAGDIELSDEDVDRLRALYDASLCHVDRQVGRLMARLDRLGLDDRTLVIITSDHGESFGERGLFDHQYGLYEHLIAVPLVLRLPGRERRGRTPDRLVQHTDLVPTLTELAGLAGPDFAGGLAAGTSARPVFRDPPREAVIAEYLVPNLEAMRRRFPDRDLSRFDMSLRSIREGRFKLIRSRGASDRLYDLRSDPKETVDLASSQSEVAARLRDRLEAAVGDWPVREQVPIESDADLAEVRERLEALGYL